MSDAYPRLVLPVEWKVDAIDIAHVGRLAQLARASPLQGEGRGFESLNAHRVVVQCEPREQKIVGLPERFRLIRVTR